MSVLNDGTSVKIGAYGSYIVGRGRAVWIPDDAIELKLAVVGLNSLWGSRTSRKSPYLSET